MTASILPMEPAAEVSISTNLLRMAVRPAVCTTAQPQTAWPRTDGSEMQLQADIDTHGGGSNPRNSLRAFGSLHGPLPVHPSFRPMCSVPPSLLHAMPCHLTQQCRAYTTPTGGQADEQGIDIHCVDPTRLSIGNRVRALLTSSQDQQSRRTERARCRKPKTIGVSCMQLPPGRVDPGT